MGKAMRMPSVRKMTGLMILFQIGCPVALESLDSFMDPPDEAGESFSEKDMDKKLFLLL